MELVYGIKDKPSLGKVFLFAVQQLLAIMAATIAVPAIVGNGLSASAALFGAVRLSTCFLQRVPALYFWEVLLLLLALCFLLLAERFLLRPATGGL